VRRGNRGGAKSEWWGTRKAREADSGNVAESAASSVCKKVRCSSSLLQPTRYVKETIKCKDVNAMQCVREENACNEREKKRKKMSTRERKRIVSRKYRFKNINEK